MIAHTVPLESKVFAMNYPIATIGLGAVAAYLMATAAAALIARAGFPLPPVERRIGCVDGLRGYLALSVLVHHFVMWMSVTRFGQHWGWLPVNVLNELGIGAVALFFMTTGLLFYPRVLTGFRACSWPRIYITRLFRIVPMVVVSVAIITAVIAARTGHGLDRGFPLAAATWISTHGEPPLLGYQDSGRLNGHVLWSLWFEWLFYLFVLPACAMAMDLMRGRLPSWALPAALLVGSLAAQALGVPLRLLPFLPMFAIGMLAYECQRREFIARQLRSPFAAVAAIAALGTGMFAFPTPFLFGLPLFGFFFTCVACGNDIGGLLRTRGALVLGECSYSIYLLHGVLLSLLFVDAGAFTGRVATDELPILLPFVAVTAALLTAMTYLLVERPLIGAGALVAKRWTGRRLRAGSQELEVAP